MREAERSEGGCGAGLSAVQSRVTAPEGLVGGRRPARWVAEEGTAAEGGHGRVRQSVSLLQLLTTGMAVAAGSVDGIGMV